MSQQYNERFEKLKDIFRDCGAIENEHGILELDGISVVDFYELAEDVIDEVNKEIIEEHAQKRRASFKLIK